MRDRWNDDCEISEVEKTLRSWLKPSETWQHKWALDYLIAKRMIDSRLDISPPIEIILKWSQGQLNSPITELLISKMKAAWRQKQYRARLVEKKSYSFILDTAVKAQLDTLAQIQKKTTSETLESLIKRAALRAEKAKMNSKTGMSKHNWFPERPTGKAYEKLR